LISQTSDKLTERVAKKELHFRKVSKPSRVAGKFQISIVEKQF